MEQKREHGRICGATGEAAAAIEVRLAAALGPSTLRLGQSPAGETVVADWDACFFAGRPIQSLADWQRILLADRLAEVMGAFVIAWVAPDGKLILGRDPIGHRSLYYAPLADGVAFSSTLRPLLQAGVVAARPHLPAIVAYLSYAYLPGRETMVPGVFKVLPGELLKFDRGHCTRTHFFSLPTEPPANAPVSEEALRQQLRSTLADAMRRLLPEGDEPVGATLSGGVDSSLVVALGQTLQSRPIHTFSLSFGPEYANELPFSSLVAQHCGTQHRIVELSPRDVLDHLDESIAMLSDPIGDPLTVPNALCFRAAAEYTGIVFNGEGGDPCFGGPKNVPMLLAELLGDGSAESFSRARSYLRAHQKCYDDLHEMLDPAVLAAAGQRSLEQAVEPYLVDPRWPSFMGKLMALNVAFKGAEHILPKVDALSAPYGVLPRSPLFDRAIVELAFAIPAPLKLRGTTEKYLLKQAVADLLPQSILDRKKSGMLVPVEGWFQGPLLPSARERLLDGLRPLGLFKPQFLEQLLDGKLTGLRPRRGVKIWLLLTLEAWLRQVLRTAAEPGANINDMSSTLREVRGHDAEVIKRAILLQERDKKSAEVAADRLILTQAAEEIGVPARYLEQAEATVLAERQAAVVRRRRFLFMGVGLAAAVACVAVAGVALRSPAPPPPVDYAITPAQWTLNKNPGSQAAVHFATEPNADATAVIAVARFVPEGPEGKYFVNFEARESLPPIEKYRSVRFSSRGQGLGTVRLFLEASPDERWRSAAIPVASAWAEHHLSLSSFEHQRRKIADGTWHRDSAQSPTGISRLSFKLGYFMNEASASGEVSLRGLHFE